MRFAQIAGRLVNMFDGWCYLQRCELHKEHSDTMRCDKCGATIRIQMEGGRGERGGLRSREINTMRLNIKSVVAGLRAIDNLILWNIIRYKNFPSNPVIYQYGTENNNIMFPSQQCLLCVNISRVHTNYQNGILVLLHLVCFWTTIYYCFIIVEHACLDGSVFIFFVVFNC